MVNVKSETWQGDAVWSGGGHGMDSHHLTPVWISTLEHFRGPAQSIFCSDHQSEQLESEVSKDSGVNA